MDSQQLQTVEEFKQLLRGLNEAKVGLLDGLLMAQFPEGGWPTLYPDDRTSHNWTLSQCLRAILACGAYPRHYEEAIQLLLAKRTHEGGWSRSRGMLKGDYFNNYCTADAILALVEARRFEDCTVPLQKLQLESRNNDYGWGVIKGDEISKVRTTCWAIQALLAASRAPVVKQLVNREDLQKSIDWLIGVKSEDGGWGYMPKEAACNVTATAWATYVLLESKKTGLDVEIEQLSRPIEKLREAEIDGRWAGTPETCEVYVGGRFAGTHRAAGLGTALVIRTFTKAVEHSLLLNSDPALLRGVTRLCGSCKRYRTFRGRWIIPSSLGEERPTLWDSSYALLFLVDFERALLEFIADRFLSEIATSITLSLEGARNEIQTLKEQLIASVDVINEVSKKEPRNALDYIKRQMPDSISRQLAIHEIVAGICEAGAVAEYQSLTDMIGWLLSACAKQRFDLVGFPQVVKDLPLDRQGMDGVLEECQREGWIKQSGSGWVALPLDPADHLFPHYFVLGWLGEKLRSDRASFRAIVRSKSAIPQTATRAKLMLACERRMKLDGYTIQDATKIRGIEFDLIGERPRLIGSEVVVGKVFTETMEPADVQRLASDLERVQQSDKIRKVYLAAGDYREELLKVLSAGGRFQIIKCEQEDLFHGEHD